MGQRLVRAKIKIRDAGLRFAVPEPEDMPARLADVLAAVYAAYGTGWEAPRTGLAEEAIYLGRLLVELLPAEPEARGLLALMLYCEARREARRDAAGRFVPLARQDARLWSGSMIAEAEALLAGGARAGRFGRYLCEAAIQSVHIQRPVTGRTDYRALRLLYDLLAAHEPGLGVLVARAALLLEAGDAAAARLALDALGDAGTGYQPYWVAQARLLRTEGRQAEAEAALATALRLTEDPALQEYLASPQ
jgi:RNA polymerase sigma-70 factor (ECF subfamily)